MRTLVVASLAASFIALVACGEVDPYGELQETSVTAAATSTCPPQMAGVEPTLLPACTGTKAASKGRCVPKAMLDGFGDTFEQATCKADAICVPEELVKGGSSVKLKKCTAVLNAEGRCFWPLAKDIITNYDNLKKATKDQCEGEQVCAPCVNPFTGADTGLCKIGEPAGPECASKEPKKSGFGGACPTEEPFLDEKGLKQEDCTSNMVCVDTALVGDQAARLAKCKKGVCAPKKSVLRGGNYVPKTCKSTANAEGRCVNVGVPDIGAQKDRLPKADCDADERCAPCFDPRDGKETGACAQAPCDKPKEPAKTFSQCCGGKGRCVTKELAGANSESLGADSCSGDTPLCAPNEFVGTAKPRTCKSLIMGKGVCLSRCSVTTGGAFARFVQGDCESGELCAPCDQVPPGTEGCGP